MPSPTFPRYGAQGYIPSGESEGTPSMEKLKSLMELMGGAPNGVLAMIARILQSGEPKAPPMPSNVTPMGNEEWNRMYPMPPTPYRINTEPFQRPIDNPEGMPTMPWGGAVRG